MAGVTQRRTTTTSSSSSSKNDNDVISSSNGHDDEKKFKKTNSTMTETDNSGSEEESSSPKNNGTTNKDNDGGVKLNYSENGKGKSMSDRKQIPKSFYIILGTIVGIQYFSDTYSMKTVTSYINSMTSSYNYMKSITHYAIYDVLLGGYLNSTNNNNTNDIINQYEYIKVILIGSLCISLFYIFFFAPYRAGFWTGRRTNRHKMHRYMGLLYLIHYGAAWLEYFSPNYNPIRGSYLCHFIAINGTLYFDFLFFVLRNYF